MEEKGFKYSILASGSSGNLLFKPKEKSYGCGLSARKSPNFFEREINRKPEDLMRFDYAWTFRSYPGVGIACKYGIIYANEKTWQAAENSKYLARWIYVKLFLKWVKPKPLRYRHWEFWVSHICWHHSLPFMKDDKSRHADTGYVSDRMAGIVENDGYPHRVQPRRRDFA